MSYTTPLSYLESPNLHPHFTDMMASARSVTLYNGIQIFPSDGPNEHSDHDDPGADDSDQDPPLQEVVSSTVSDGSVSTQHHSLP